MAYSVEVVGCRWLAEVDRSSNMCRARSGGSWVPRSSIGAGDAAGSCARTLVGERLRPRAAVDDHGRHRPSGVGAGGIGGAWAMACELVVAASCGKQAVASGSPRTPSARGSASLGHWRGEGASGLLRGTCIEGADDDLAVAERPQHLPVGPSPGRRRWARWPESRNSTSVRQQVRRPRRPPWRHVRHRRPRCRGRPAAATA